MSRIELGGRSITTIEIQRLLTTDHPLVERFQFVRTACSRSDRLTFALQIVPRRGGCYQQQRDRRGQRVPAVWKTLTGQETIGHGDRAIWLEGDQLVAENTAFFPNQEFNDLGIGSALYVAMERLYRALGICRVTLLAVDVGVYVWARQGFAFATHGALPGLVDRLQRLVRRHDPMVSLEPADFDESWGLANYDRPPHTIDGHRLGKAFMLSDVPSWYGVKDLDNPQHTAIAEASRRETFARLSEKIANAPTLAVR